MNTNEQDKKRLEALGFTYEYPGFWLKIEGERYVTLSDGPENEGMWCIQLTDPEGRCSAGANVRSLDVALRTAQKMLKPLPVRRTVTVRCHGRAAARPATSYYRSGRRS